MILTISCLLFVAGVLMAQNNGILAIGFGGAVNYYYGPTSRNFDSYEGDRVNGQLDGLLGISLGRNKQGNRTLIAAFGTYGLTNRSTLRQMLDDQGYVTAATSQSAQNNFFHLEGGLLLGEIFRISTGVGQQFFNDQTLVSGSSVRTNVSYLKYNSTTAGFYLNVSAVAIMVNANFAYGQDFNHTVLTPSVGLTFKF